jgi:hypothetical protein
VRYFTAIGLLVGAHAVAQPVQLRPPGQPDGAFFGYATSISADGRVALVGAPNYPGRAVPSSEQTGAAYLFSRSGNSWHLDTMFVGPPGAKMARDVALSSDGQTALLTSSSHDCVYFLIRGEQRWEMAEILPMEDGVWILPSGSALSEDGSTALVGVAFQPVPAGPHTGGALVLERSGDSWTETARLVGDDDVVAVGGSVALTADGSVALLGTSPVAQIPENPPPVLAGFVFRRISGAWSREARLGPLGTRPPFGFSVALDAAGTLAVVHADRPTHRALQPYRLIDGVWSEVPALEFPDMRSTYVDVLAMSGDGSRILFGSSPAPLFEGGGDSWRWSDSLSIPGYRSGYHLSMSSDGHTALLGSVQPYDTPGEVWVFDLTPPTGGEPPPPPEVSFALSPPHPNPAADAATLSFTSYLSGDVRLELFDGLGRRVSLPFEGPVAAGSAHSVRIDVSGLAPGAYVLVARGPRERTTRRLVVAR